MSVAEQSKYIITSRYAGHLPDKKRRETWYEMSERVMGMHREKYSPISGLDEVFAEVEEAIKKKVCLGSQRALQFGGKPILKKNARLYNCCASYADRPRFFQEAFWLLLCGCGVGFSVQKHHVAKLPKLVPPDPERIINYVIEDSIEGWADSVGVLLASYGLVAPGFEQYAGKTIVFIYSKIRLKGSKLSSSTGKAPGPEPLEKALENARVLLYNAIGMGLTHLRPIDVYDIIMHLSDAVLSGGVRRSATICLFSVEDHEMATAKTGNWFKENPQRGRSNNSAVLIRNVTTREQFHQLMQWVKEYGEPGFYWTDDPDILCNPCVEIGFYCYWEENGELLSGWHFCNLTEINGKKCKTKEDFYHAARQASVLGTLQAGYTKFDYLGEITEKIVKREALLGVSITGMMDNPDTLFNPEYQREAVRIIRETNEWLAPILGHNPAARYTCVKPAGTSSGVLGSSSGFHPHHYIRYFRLVQSNMLEAPFQHFKSINPQAVENSVWDPNNQTGVIYFCIEVEPGAKMKNQFSAVDLLALVKSTQENWVLPGTVVERCSHPRVTHNVSNTVNVKPTEWDAVEEYIFLNREYFAGVALLPITGDKDYPQAPFQAVYTPREQVEHYGDGILFASGLIEDGLDAYANNLWAACADALAYQEQHKGKLIHEEWEVKKYIKKRDKKWISEALKGNGKTGYHRHQDYKKLRFVYRLLRFAARYFNGDVKKTTYALKDVFNWKKWLDLKATYKPVNYTKMYEEEDNTDYVRDTVACGNGQCSI